jgi:hypothetical protein
MAACAVLGAEDARAMLLHSDTIYCGMGAWRARDASTAMTHAPGSQ